MNWIPAHEPVDDCPYLDTDRGCYWCCSACDHAEHRTDDGRPTTHNGVVKVKARA